MSLPRLTNQRRRRPGNTLTAPASTGYGRDFAGLNEVAEPAPAQGHVAAVPTTSNAPTVNPSSDVNLGITDPYGASGQSTLAPGVTGRVDAQNNLTVTIPGASTPLIVGPGDPMRPRYDQAFQTSANETHQMSSAREPASPAPTTPAPPAEAASPAAAPPVARSSGGRSGPARPATPSAPVVSGPPGWAQIISSREQRISDARGQGVENVARAGEQALAQDQAAEEERQQRMAQAERDVAERVSAVENMRVDPNNWFASRGVVGSIGAAIAVGMGAAAQSLTGSGPNNALGIINAAIDRDIAAQSENMRNAGMRLQNRESALGRLRAELGDDRAAEEAFRMRTLAIAEARAGEMAARATNPTAQELAAQTQQAIAGQRELSRQAFEQNLMVAQARRHGSGGGGSGRSNLSAVQQRAANQRAVQEQRLANADTRLGSIQRRESRGEHIRGTGYVESMLRNTGPGLLGGIARAGGRAMGITPDLDPEIEDAASAVNEAMNELGQSNIPVAEMRRFELEMPNFANISSPSDATELVARGRRFVARARQVIANANAADAAQQSTPRRR